eukprot:jgi/Mesvir1/2405/Mv22147-RA.1
MINITTIDTERGKHEVQSKGNLWQGTSGILTCDSTMDALRMEKERNHPLLRTSMDALRMEKERNHPLLRTNSMDALRMEKERNHPLLRTPSAPTQLPPSGGFLKKFNSMIELPNPIASAWLRRRHGIMSQACDFRDCARSVSTPAVPEACDSRAASGDETYPRPVSRILEAPDPRSSHRRRCGAPMTEGECAPTSNPGCVIKFRELAEKEVLSEADVRLISQSWAVICDQVDSPMDFGMVFYDHLSKLAPEVVHLFSVQRCTQAMSFALMVKHIVALLENQSLLIESLEKCAHRHIQYGVLPQHFPVVGEALIRTLAEFLGADKHMDISVARAWEHLWSILSEIMLKEIARVDLQPCAPCMAGSTCPSKIDVGKLLPMAKRAH